MSLASQTKRCSRCEKEKPLSDYYKRSNRKHGYQTYCKTCNNETRIEQTRANKEKAVVLLGGQCVRCGYQRCSAALHFHHPDPKIKDDVFHQLRNRKWIHIKTELERQRCVLLCANCHAEEHFAR